jgi:nucleotide-binding universal stress UspA family protein
VGEDRQQKIVVGVGRSAASAAALSWAAAEARLRRARLYVVRVWDPARHVAPYACVGALPTCDEERAAALRDLAAVMRAEFGPVAPDDVTAELAEGVPERVLVQRSAGADMLVLGVAAAAWPDGGSPGPVVRACVARARCPVVVIGGAGAASAPAGQAMADSAAR